MNIVHILLVNTATLLVYMSAWFIVAYRQKRLDVVDTAWGGGFIVLALSTFIQAPHLYSGLIALLVVAWGLRLALHIARRNRKKSNDARYDIMTVGWNKRWYWLRAYLAIFLAQGALVFVVGLPISMSATILSTLAHPLAYVGLVIWLAGFITEAVADGQLDTFIKNRTVASSIMQTGLWRYSRHPNYFGEITLWWGIAVIASASMPWWPVWIGPLCITYLIIFISGLPPLEKHYQDNHDYQVYAAKTSPLIPLPPK